jgi:serine protease Do
MTVRRLLAAALLSLLAAPPATAQFRSTYATHENAKVLAPFKGVVAGANESTVRVRCDDKEAALGAVVFEDGYILTKASELRGQVTVRLHDGGEYDADIVAVHKPTDLALIRIDARGLKPVTFTDSKKVPVGNWLAAAGPTTDPVAVGIVSVVTRSLSGFDPAIDLNMNRGFLGITLDTKDDDGAKIGEVSRDGAAAKAGLKVSDVIYEVNGTRVTGQQQLRELLENYRPGDAVNLKVRRAGEELSFKATLTDQPRSSRSRGDIQNAMGGNLSGRRSGFPAVLQTDMVLDPKDCGGPVVDLDGKVLGVSIARAGRVETWVLPSENIRPLLADLKAGKFPPISLIKKEPK